MIKGLFPTGVAAVEAFDDATPAPLYPEESALLGNAVAKRRDEFATARRCARQALGLLGHSPGPIMAGPRREPLWPAGVTGAITHCAGYRAAVVARAGEFSTLGVDAEPHGPLPDGILETIAGPAERQHLALLRRRHPAVHWDRLVFSAKETVFKAWYPLTERWLDFDEATVTFDAGRATFAARLLVPGPVVGGIELGGFSGRWLVGRGLLVTGIAVAALRPAVTMHPLPDLIGY
ncbi:4'-phosphopantetheinyl transferase family protein [Dactylosporangium matsuzakiense]|uniref:4'-phosphopantetheinyl transferase n=1 Tax=Dactylosporangium matsuzakiense TaxID=53360 RepID=A0A9W6KWB8_9ACTN|nr:4'-phosphopantetheinyl transferase superfamily protein [Dactylosporangium matsuzakiense]UWZ41192.1 4'-phosphopantetheinyl transferase superfamily protein [Dactylosporangium matsuzakiense]GLL08385.1 4'-phosphopantetheinyl transferase [Dactylosporangium matsuzakiense]